MFNIIDIIAILVILISVFIGYKKGFVKTILNLLSFFIAIAVALTFYKPLAVILTENTTIDDWIVEKIVFNNEEKNIEEDKELTLYVSGDNFNETLEDKNDFETILNMIGNLPNTITNNLELEEIKNNTKHEFAYKISEQIMNLLSLIIIYVVVKLTLVIATYILHGIMQIPVLKQLNEILGMGIGAVLGFIQLYIAFAIITFISSIADISVVIETIKISVFASVLFENNLIINLLF